MNSTPSGANGGHARLRDAPHTHGPGAACPGGDTAFGVAWSGPPAHLLSNQPWAEPLSLHPMTPAYVVCHELSAWDGRLLGALLQRVTSAAPRYLSVDWSASSRPSRTGTGSVKGRWPVESWPSCSARRGAGQGGSAAFEGETAGRQGLAGRTRAGPAHAGCGRERARRRVMSRIIDQ
jgi:hypothetical protein